MAIVNQIFEAIIKRILRQFLLRLHKNGTIPKEEERKKEKNGGSIKMWLSICGHSKLVARIQRKNERNSHFPILLPGIVKG